MPAVLENAVTLRRLSRFLDGVRSRFVAKSDLSGGAAGQALVKASGADGDYTWGDVAASGGADREYVDLHDAFSTSVDMVPGASVTLDCSGAEPSALDERRAAAFGAENMYMVDVTAEQAAKLYEVMDVAAISAVAPDDEKMVEALDMTVYAYEPGASIDCRVYVYVRSNGDLNVLLVKPGEGDPEYTDFIGQVDCDLEGGMFAMLDSTDVREVTFYPEGATSADPVEVVSYAPKDGAARATQTADGIMTAADKAKLDALDPDLVTVGSVAATSPITATLDGREVTIAHKASGVVAGTYGSNTGTVKKFGDEFIVPLIYVESKGHVYHVQDLDLKFPSETATQSANGLMSYSDKKKLDSAVVSVEPLGSAAGISVTAQSTGNLKLAHQKLAAQKTCGDTRGNRDLGFQQGFTVPKVSIDSNGHVTDMEDVTLVIPSTTATATEAGLMSAADKAALDALSSAEGAVVENVWASFGDDQEHPMNHSPFGWTPVLTRNGTGWSLTDMNNFFENASNCTKANTDAGWRVTRTSADSGFGFAIDVGAYFIPGDLPGGTYAMVCSMEFGGSCGAFDFLPTLMLDDLDGGVEMYTWTRQEPSVIVDGREGVAYQLVITYDVESPADLLGADGLDMLCGWGYRLAFGRDVEHVDIYDMEIYRVNDAGGTTVPQAVVDYVDGKLGSMPAGGGFEVAATAPSDTGVLWVDTSVGGVLKYHDGSAWVACKSVWG